MRADLLSLRHFQEVIQRQSLLIATYNTTVVAYLQNQGETHSFSLYLLCREILLLCDSFQTVLKKSFFSVVQYKIMFISYHSNMSEKQDRYFFPFLFFYHFTNFI
jgi:hypothetical protein